MSDPSPEDLAEADRWMQEAEEELAVAARIASAPELPGRIACFHSHLAAEKAIKSSQIRREVPVRKVHNLVQLVRGLPEADRQPFAAEDLDLLNPWTIDGRYPTDYEAINEGEVRRVLESAGRTSRDASSIEVSNISFLTPPRRLRNAALRITRSLSRATVFWCSMMSQWSSRTRRGPCQMWLERDNPTDCARI